MKNYIAILAFCAALALSCTKAQLVVVTHTATTACSALEVVTSDARLHTLCLGVDTLDKLFTELVAAQKMGVGALLVVEQPDGGTQRLELAPAQVGALASRVGLAVGKSPP